MGVAAIGQSMQLDSDRSGASPSDTEAYRVDKIGSHAKPWIVRFDDPSAIPLGLFNGDSWTAYPTRRLALAAVTHLEVLRERRIKFVRHIVLAAFWATASVVAYIVMAVPEQAFQVEWFVLALVAVFFFLNETLEGFLVVIDEGWDRFYEIRTVSRTDRLIARIIFSPFTRMRRSDIDVDSGVVRVVDGF